ncbi:hypothetical protein NDU88_003761 [Pleurodeles waltl]|uniref:Uncharacterized protein n=1 Tax=Pleurodeles waltl TaxID=8319 RepID=A0AAV7PER7_PLEWA|nr:hypothetical protein NDU88_003761 [Pleurodeles waltl]
MHPAGLRWAWGPCRRRVLQIEGRREARRERGRAPAVDPCRGSADGPPPLVEEEDTRRYVWRTDFIIRTDPHPLVDIFTTKRAGVPPQEYEGGYEDCKSTALKKSTDRGKGVFWLIAFQG